MAMFLDEDYDELEQRDLSYVEDETNRFFVIQNYELPSGLYQQAFCDVLVVVPANYPQAGNDMFWTYPRLTRADGKPIPNTTEVGGGDSKSFDGKEFCRWSRHWNGGSSVWRPGMDGIVTILRRVECALRKPDTK